MYQTIKENARAGFVEILILELLTERDMYGYEIGQELKNRANGVFIQAEGSLYTPLYRLERNGFVSSYKTLEDDKYRRYYHIEKNGLEYLSLAKKEIKTVYKVVMNILKLD